MQFLLGHKKFCVWKFFWSKNIFCPKKLWGLNKIWVWKNYRFKKSVGSKKSWVKKKFKGSKKILDKKNFSLKNSGSEKILGLKKNLKFWVRKRFQTTIRFLLFSVIVYLNSSCYSHSQNKPINSLCVKVQSSSTPPSERFWWWGSSSSCDMVKTKSTPNPKT